MNQYETPRNLWTLLAVLADTSFIIECFIEGFSFLVLFLALVATIMAWAAWWCWSEEEEYLKPQRRFENIWKDNNH